MPRLAPALIVFALSSAPVAARDISGHLGIGGNVDTGPLGSGLSLRYWVSNLGLEVDFGFTAHHSTDDPALTNAENAGYVEYRPAGRVLYAMTRTRLANLYVGAGLSALIRKSKEQGDPVAYFDAMHGAQEAVLNSAAADPRRRQDVAGPGRAHRAAARRPRR